MAQRKTIERESSDSGVGTYLSAAEIDRRFPKQWVLVNNPKATRDDEILGGTLLFHADRRDQIYEWAAGRADLKETAIWYTGPIDPNLRFAL